MTTDNGSPRTSRFILTSMGAVVVCALTILGFAIVTVMTNSNVVEVPEVTPLASAFGIVAAGIVWSGVVYRAIGRRGGAAHAVLAGVLATVAYLVGLGLFALGAGVAASLSVVSHIVVGGFVVVILVAGIIVAGGVLALSRAGGSRPRWAWENDEDDPE